jgi:hypothetical protein
MKKNLIVCGLIVLGMAGAAQAAIILDTDWTVDEAIPAGYPTGITVSQSFPNLYNGEITSVSVDLNISGGFNGGLYGYLVYQDANGNTATETLLNYIGTSPSNPFGSSGAGLNVTLSDSGTINGSIHGATGIPTGTWLPDSSITLNSTFGGMAADGTWTLFLADMYAGDTSGTLESWGLEVTAIPEPAEAGLILGIGGLVALGLGLWNRSRRQGLQV